MYQALIFDVDGTLADTERDGHRVASNRAFHEHGLDWEWGPELYGELLEVTGGKARMKHYMDRYHKELPHDGDLESVIAEIHATKTRYFTDLVTNEGLALRSGVKRLFIEARAAGYRLAIATTTTPSNVDALIINNLGAEALAWFDIIGAGFVVPKLKPAADIYDYVLDELGLRPEQALAFEDSYNGVSSAIGAGLDVLVTTNDYTRDHDFTGSCVVLNRLGDPGRPATVLESQIPELVDRKMVDLPFIETLASALGR